jgi:replicative DNA helicase
MPLEKKKFDAAIDRLPPQDLNAEIYVLGAMLQDDVAAAKAIEFFGEDGETCFYKTDHQEIYNAIVAVFDSSQKIDVLTVGRELERRGELDKIGGNYFLTGLVERTPSAANIIAHARVVLEKSTLRMLAGAGVETTTDAFDVTASSDAVIDRAEQRLLKLAARKLRNGFVSVNPVLQEAFNVIDASCKNPNSVIGVPTGLIELDKATNGLQKSDLIIIAGRPSTGKTALALNITRNAAIDHKVGVGFFSLEMARWQLGIRLICTESRVDSHRARGGKITPAEMMRMASAVGKIDNASIFIDDSPSLSATEIRAKARRLSAEKNIGLIVVDYLQIMRHSDGENRNISIGYTTQSLKALAKELDIPVVILSQLSRNVENRSTPRPILADLRESGAIEQDADVVLFPFAPEGEGVIIIGKQRNGPTIDVPVLFQKEFTRFVDLSPRGDINAGSNRYEREPERADLPF